MGGLRHCVTLLAFGQEVRNRKTPVDCTLLGASFHPPRSTSTHAVELVAGQVPDILRALLSKAQLHEVAEECLT
jgi:hypothetical protein